MANRSWRRVQPIYPVLPATLPQAAALPAGAPALAAARQQRNEPAQGQRAVRAAQRAEPAPASAQLGLGAQPPTQSALYDISVVSKDVCQAVASPTALRGSDPVSELGIKAFKGHLIKWLNAANWSREKSVLRLMILEAPTCCWI